MVAAVAGLLAGPREGLAGLAGAVAVLAGTLTMARFALGGGVQSGEAVMLRMLVGMVSKWAIAALLLLLALGVLRLPPVPAVAGVAAALVAAVIAALGKS